MTDESDGRTLIEALADAYGGDVHDLAVIVLDGNPGPKQRPRFNRRGGVWKPDEADEAAVGWQIRQAMRAQRLVRFDGPVAVGLLFYRRTRHRVDEDNLLKRVLDAANGVLFGDDSQIMVQSAAVRHDPEHPRTVLAIADYTDPRALLCQDSGQKVVGGARRRVQSATVM